MAQTSGSGGGTGCPAATTAPTATSATSTTSASSSTSSGTGSGGGGGGGATAPAAAAPAKPASICGCDYAGVGNIFLPKRLKRVDMIKKQAYPFGLNKYVVMTMGCISICLTSSLYYNWTIFEDMFMREGILSYLCTAEELREAEPNKFVCDIQRRWISNLYSAIMYTDSFVGIIGGYIGDRYGAFYALLIGQCSGIVAFLMFYLFSSSAITLGLTFFFWGISCSFALAPTWHYSRMFTFGNNMAVSMITAADNLSMFTPSILKSIANRYSIGFLGSCLTYIFWALFTSIAITLYFIPNRFIVLDEEEDENEYNFNNMFNDHFANALKDHRYWLSVVCYVLLCSVRLFYRRSFTLLFFDNEEVTTFLEEASDLSFVGSFVLGYMNEYFGVVTMMGLTTVMYIIALIAIYFRNFPCAYTSALLFAIAQAGDIQQLVTFIDEVFPEHESTLMGIANIVNTVGGLLLQVVFNYIFDLCGPRITVFLMILILCGVIFICTVIGLGMREAEVKKLEEEKEEEEEKKEEKPKECKEEGEPYADEEDTAYNPFGPQLLLSNLLGVILSFPYYLTLCTSVAINNMGQVEPVDESEKKPRVVRSLERIQFYSSSDRVVELCATVFYTGIFMLFCCIYQFSRHNEYMSSKKTFVILVSSLIGTGVVCTLLLPYVMIMQVLPPIISIAFTMLPPMGFVILSYVEMKPHEAFITMVFLVVLDGVILFSACNTMLYINSLMGARYGKSVHSLLGWSHLGMGYIYCLLLMFSIHQLYNGKSVLGGYNICMAMQCILNAFATAILSLYLDHESQYFCCDESNLKKQQNGATGQQQGQNGGQTIVCPKDVDDVKHNDYFGLRNSNGCTKPLHLCFVSKRCDKFKNCDHADYGLWNLNYLFPGLLSLSLDLLLLSLSIAIGLSDISIFLISPQTFLWNAVPVVAFCFTVRMLFMFFSDFIDGLGIGDLPNMRIFWPCMYGVIIVLLAINIIQLKWITGDIVSVGARASFSVVFGLRVAFNVFLQHHMFLHLERFKINTGSTKNDHAKNVMMYVNIGHCLGLVGMTLISYYYYQEPTAPADAAS
ncbi:integral membrane protein protein [Babesia ovis]|uniref:Integral membrane protein protein n=1 Tax=Babesia ovis TaxID=5869 RepID=A0A9W5WW92_BABOV|nr:integral membrane protein protein [Babesia ovis]